MYAPVYDLGGRDIEHATTPGTEATALLVRRDVVE